MKTTTIDQNKKNKDQKNDHLDMRVSSSLNQFMASQFRATITQFQSAKLEATSPLNGLMKANIVKDTTPVPQPINISNLQTLAQPIEKASETQKASTVAEVVNAVTNQAQIVQSKKAGEYQGIVQKASQQYGVPVALINAVIKQESNFNHKAVSHAGAQGLMQLMPATARGYGVNNSFDAEQNIMGGTHFLSDLLKKYKGDVKLALAGYNAGPGNVAKYGNTIPPFKETQNYVKKVFGYYNQNLGSVEQTTQKFAQAAQTGAGEKT